MQGGGMVERDHSIIVDNDRLTAVQLVKAIRRRFKEEGN
jgi:hypothetical protein